MSIQPAVEPSTRQGQLPPARISGNIVARRAQKRRALEGSAIFGAQVLIGFGLLAGMYALNAIGGNLLMPSPTSVARQSFIMWTDGTMLAGLGQSLTVIVLGFLLSAMKGMVESEIQRVLQEKLG